MAASTLSTPPPPSRPTQGSAHRPCPASWLRRARARRRTRAAGEEDDPGEFANPANEKLPSEQPLIEEPEDEPENPQPTADHIPEEAPSNPSGEDGQNQADRTQGNRSEDHYSP
ncbi:hypothetical protein U9M48_039948 [Paspalum notatum var. saurae]|uniref:Uncharacterized protein n=1 Tax=Paspalum notatum var. saurae TaxID=547442 RepID=A0AAQ3UKP3_PASNO